MTKRYCFMILMLASAGVFVSSCRDSAPGNGKPVTLLHEKPADAPPVSSLLQQEPHGLLAAPRLSETLEFLDDRRMELNPRIASVSQKGGRYYIPVALSKNQFAVASLRGVDFFDLQTAENGRISPSLQADTPGDAWSIDVIGSNVWVADGYAGVTVLDSKTGSILMRRPDLEHARAFHTMHDGRLVVCRHRQGATIATVDDSGMEIVSLTHIDAGERVFSAASDNNRVFLGTLGAGYQAYDIAGDSIQHRWTYDDCTRIVWCEFKAGYHFLLDQDRGLMILEDRGDHPPVLKSFIELPGQSRHACFADTEHLVIAHQNSAICVNISDRRSPRIVSRLPSNLEGRGVAPMDGMIVFTESEYGLRIVKCVNGDLLPVVVFEHNGLVSDVLMLENGQALITHTGKGVALIDACHQSYPEELYRWSNQGYPVAGAVRDTLVAVADYEGVVLLNINHDYSIEKVAKLTTPGRAVNAAFRGDYLFVADWFEGVHIVSLSNVSKPVIVSTIPVKGWATDVAVKDNIVYICSVTEGLVIVDIASIETPEILTTDTTTQAPEAITLTDHAMYVADFNFGLLVFDIDNPSMPRAVSSYRLDVAKSLVVRDTLLIVSNYIYGLKWFDISQPHKPVLTGELDTPGKAYKAVFCGSSNRILVADWHDFLVVEWE